MRQLHQSLMLSILLFAVITLNVQASNLVVFDELHEDFTLVVNGYRINNTPSQHVRVTGLQPSQYTVVAIFVNPSMPRQTIYLNLQADREISYALVRGATKGPLEFAFLSEYSLGYFPIAPQSVTTVAYGGPLTDPEPMPVDPSPVPVQPVPVQPGTIVIQPAPGTPIPPNPLPGYNGPIGCAYPMDPMMQFGDAKRSVESKTFSDTKMQVAKQITRNNCLLTSQVADLMALFSFESQKLEFAKFAYEFTYDKGNYYKVNDQFGFESSVRDLEQFLRGR
jgi:hypothetical protein